MGIGIFKGTSNKDQVEYFKKFGIKRTFIGSEKLDFEMTMQLLQIPASSALILYTIKKMVQQSLHSPKEIREVEI